MRKYTTLLWDIDGTLLDFEAVEKVSLKACFEKFSLGEFTEEMLLTYMPINRKYWQALERGEYTKKEILVKRFEDFFVMEGIDPTIAADFDQEYQKQLGSHFVFHTHGEEIVKQLDRDGYDQYAATNGTIVAQRNKLSISGLDQIFKHLFISDEMGHEKPSVEFYQVIFDTLHIEDRSKVLMIGDSLTSDIKGGINAGIDTCWFNPKQQPNDSDVQPTYEIHHLDSLLSILE